MLYQYVKQLICLIHYHGDQNPCNPTTYTDETNNSGTSEVESGFVRKKKKQKAM